MYTKYWYEILRSCIITENVVTPLNWRVSSFKIKFFVQCKFINLSLYNTVFFSYLTNVFFIRTIIIIISITYYNFCLQCALRSLSFFIEWNLYKLQHYQIFKYINFLYQCLHLQHTHHQKIKNHHFHTNYWYILLLLSCRTLFYLFFYSFWSVCIWKVYEKNVSQKTVPT